MNPVEKTLSYAELALNDLQSQHGPEILRSIILVAFLVAVRLIIGRLLGWNESLRIEDRRQWLVNSRNILFMLGVLGLGLIWARELESLLLSVLALGVGLIIATKELILCVSGTLVRRASNSYSVGDDIQLGTIRGRVIDVGWLATTVLEFGPGQGTHLMTGRILTFANSLVLTQTVSRENTMGSYVMHHFQMQVPYSVPPQRSLALVRALAFEQTLPYFAPAYKQWQKQKKRHFIDSPQIEPQITLQTATDLCYALHVRLVMPDSQRQEIEQHIIQGFLTQAFPDPDPLPDTLADASLSQFVAPETLDGRP
ncbi:mechanosensitive ion channel domain-containing protein [Amphibiibacter pelophylacis]|uniref:Mechanosensitive ion channel n=1 Tax=Amphibiibacter pelophylacis TaxID=1799477 RepID=A0ACC6P0Y8_9BURK